VVLPDVAEAADCRHGTERCARFNEPPDGPFRFARAGEFSRNGAILSKGKTEVTAAGAR